MCEQLDGIIVKYILNFDYIHNQKRETCYNGIINPDWITQGQVLEIPSKRELLGVDPLPVSSDTELAAPNGLEQILNVFGNIFEFIQDDGSLNEQRWHREYFTRTRLPFSIPLSWDPSNYVLRLLCHKQLADVFSETMDSNGAAIGREEIKIQCTFNFVRAIRKEEDPAEFDLRDLRSVGALRL